MNTTVRCAYKAGLALLYKPASKQIKGTCGNSGQGSMSFTAHEKISQALKRIRCSQKLWHAPALHPRQHQSKPNDLHALFTCFGLWVLSQSIGKGTISIPSGLIGRVGRAWSRRALGLVVKQALVHTA